MYIYHGTSYKNLKNILKNGIVPRGKLNKGNWEKFPSRSDMIYLTTAYPFYFAYCAADRDNCDKCVVFEIEMNSLPYKNFYPDEDFIQQAIEGATIDDHSNIREHLLEFRQHAEQSLKHMGNICYRGIIPIENIKKYCIVNFDKRHMLAMEIMDPTISIMNYKFCGQKYRDLVSWFFDNGRQLPAIKRTLEFMQMDNKPEGMNKQLERQLTMWEKENVDRTGIQVVKL